MKKIILIIDSLAGGGTQHFLKNFSEQMINMNKHEIHILCFYDYKEKNLNFPSEIIIKFFSLPVNNDNTFFFNKFIHNIKKILFLRKNLKNINPNAAISFIGRTNILFIISSFGLKFKKIISERNNPKKQSLGIIWNFLRKILYKRADLITVNSIPAYNFLIKSINVNKVFFLPNIIKNYINHKTDFKIKKNILSIGRLEPQKNYFFLLKAFSELIKTNRDYQLNILGEGSQKKSLIEYAQKLNIDKNVKFLGYKDNIEIYCFNADLLIMTSFYEGMPNEAIEHILQHFKLTEETEITEDLLRSIDTYINDSMIEKT